MSILSKLFGNPEPKAPNSKAESVGNEPPPSTDIGGGRGMQRVDQQVWHTLLASGDLEGLLVARDEIDDVVSLMVESRIDPRKFLGNLAVLLSGGNRATEAYSLWMNGGGTLLPSTASMDRFLWTADPPRGLPLWFLAGFPDVVSWFEDEQLALFNLSVDEEERTEATAKLFGLDLDASHDPDGTSFHNDDGTLRFYYCRSLVANYIRKTGKSLEVAVQEGSEDDIYAGSDLLQMAGEENNLTLMASMTTKYYLELRRRYGRLFPNETALLSMSGILEAGNYIFGTRQLTAAQVIAVAKETEGMQDRIQEFFIRLGTFLLSVDEAEFSLEEVGQVCKGQAEAIRRSIKRTTDSYKGEPRIVDSVRAVMLSPQFSELRQEVGVSIVRS